MARLGAIGTGGNFTTAGTWGVIDPTAAWTIDADSLTLIITTSTSTHISPSATPGAITVDGVYLKIFSIASGPTGTFSVVLRNTTAGTDVTSVVVNVADLPVSGWCFFKFSLPQTLLAATAYAIRLTTSASTQVYVYRSGASAQEFTRLIRTTTTAAPGAGDQMIICKELTGQGTDNGTNTITGDMTASTIYGSTTYTDSIGIGQDGVFTWGTSASTNYLLTVAGRIKVWDQGTWNRGTSGTRIPSTSTAILKFSVATNVDSGFDTSATGTVTVNNYGNIVASTSTLMTVSRGGYVTTVGTAVTRISGQSFTGLTGSIVINSVTYTISSVTNSSLLVLTGSAGTQSSAVAFTHPGTATTLTVASTSGWATGDTLAIASTSRTRTDCEQVEISTIDSATQVTLTSALTKQHSGESPTQAEVIHLMRNVRIQGTSTSLQAYVTYNATSVVNDSYCSFQYLGSGTTDKRGINVNTTTGSYTAVGCVVKDGTGSSGTGWMITSTTSNNISITYCSVYNTGAFALNIAATTGTAITISHFIAMLNGSGVTISDAGVTCTYITVVGCGASGAFTLTNSADITGEFSNITAHSNGNSGIVLTGITSGTVTNFTSWRNSSSGFENNSVSTFILNGLTAFGNSGYNIISAIGSHVTYIDVVASGDIIFSANQGIGIGAAKTELYNCTFGVVSGIKTAHFVTDLATPYASAICEAVLVNCVLASTTEFSSPSSMSIGSSVCSQNHDQAGGVRKWTKYGTSNLDTTTYRTASPSQTLTPNNASNKFASDDTQPIAIDNGQTATVTVYVYKSAAYNGNQPRLIVRRNDAIGITADTVLATCVGGTGSWIALSGTTAAATADGAFVCYVDCDGTTGTVSVDDWSVA